MVRRTDDRPARFWPIAITVLAVACALVVASPLTGPQAQTRLPESTSTTQEITMSATGRWQSVANLSAALLVAQARLGAAYAGSVIDNSAKVWNLYSTAEVSPSTMTAIRKAASRPVRINVVKVPRSYAELLRIQQLVVDLARTPAGRSINGTSIKPADNQVRVDLDPSATNALVAQVLGMAPVGAIQVGNLGSYFSAEGDRSTSEVDQAGDRLGKAESNLDGRPPYKAGKFAKLSDSPEFGRCTSGYVWTSEGEYLGSTAGHCLPDGEEFFLGTKHTTLYGKGYRNQFFGRAPVTEDVAFVRGDPATNFTPPLLWESPDTTRKVTATFDGIQATGQEVRMIGESTIQGSEGFVNEESVAGRNKQGDFIYSGATCATYSSSGGDSGAPIYQWNGPDTAIAFGVHFAVRFIDGDPEGGCFARIPLIERAASVQLLIR